ncbi:hypothetical protein L2E82_06671 [Cichorium intybus]|uniref:Uncharacterized protein n=1 Tax=Cichorium intybus TaxID=13427 RepID=A0ACB9HAL0_CICIN|nr:hypothetical protein L2E82_06671 [Cichorium intybus]
MIADEAYRFLPTPIPYRLRVRLTGVPCDTTVLKSNSGLWKKENDSDTNIKKRKNQFIDRESASKKQSVEAKVGQMYTSSSATSVGTRDYAWVKDGMIFPFLEYLDRFQGQTQLYGCKPDDFRKAIEEAYVIENGNLNSYGDKQESSTDSDSYSDSDSDADSDSDSDSDLVDIEVGTATEHDLEYFKRKKIVYNQMILLGSMLFLQGIGGIHLFC